VFEKQVSRAVRDDAWGWAGKCNLAQQLQLLLPWF
jgi:hypothetical protein